MISRLLTLLRNDLAVAFKNKTLYLIVFIPFFVFLTLKLVDQKDAHPPVLRIGLVQDVDYAPVLLQGLRSAGHSISLTWAPSPAAGQNGLKAKLLDALLLKGDKGPESLVLVVSNRESLRTLAVVEGLSALQRAAEGGRPNWISEVRSLQTGGAQKQAQPTWVLMLVLLVSFIALPAQVAEEKERNILLGLLQTPMRESEWLLAKVLAGMVMILGSVLLLHALQGSDRGNVAGYLLFLTAGSSCFCALGTLLGCLCRNQSSARTLGVIVYLPFLLPSALSDFSQRLNAFSPFLPSYWLYEPIKALWLEGSGIAGFLPYLAYLFLAGLVAFLLSGQLLKKRWLM
jgi:ABC-2 type transport system permease protein